MSLLLASAFGNDIVFRFFLAAYRFAIAFADGFLYALIEYRIFCPYSAVLRRPRDLSFLRSFFGVRRHSFSTFTPFIEQMFYSLKLNSPLVVLLIVLTSA